MLCVCCLVCLLLSSCFFYCCWSSVCHLSGLWKSRMAWMFLTRVRSTHNTCVRNAKSWATTAAVCNNHLYSESKGNFRVPSPVAYSPSRLLTSSLSRLPTFPPRTQHDILSSSCLNFLLSEASNIDSSSNPLPSFYPSSQPPCGTQSLAIMLLFW